VKGFRGARRLAHLADGPAGSAPNQWTHLRPGCARLHRGKRDLLRSESAPLFELTSLLRTQHILTALGFGKELCQPLLLRCDDEGTNERCLMLDVGRHPMHLQANCPLTPGGRLLMTQHLLHDRLASSDRMLRVRAGE
jgi:hypothetical protein